MNPFSIPNLFCRMLATGAKQFVVHDAAEMIWSSAVIVEWFTE